MHDAVKPVHVHIVVTHAGGGCEAPHVFANTGATTWSKFEGVAHRRNVLLCPCTTNTYLKATASQRLSSIRSNRNAHCRHGYDVGNRVKDTAHYTLHEYRGVYGPIMGGNVPS